jgi:hypothetical protein
MTRGRKIRRDTDKPCAWCGNLFPPSRKSNVCCSPKCSYRRTYYVDHEKSKREVYDAWLKRRLPRRSLACEYCGTPYETGYPQQRACSKSCWWKLHWRENEGRLKAKCARTRLKTVDAYRARDRDMWSRMRDERGSPEAKYMKGRYPWVPIFSGVRHRCLKTGKPFELTKEWCVRTWDGKCSLTGLPFALNQPKRSIFSPSIDRIENDKGYTEENSRWILLGLNMFKYTGTDDDIFMVAGVLLKMAGRTDSPSAPAWNKLRTCA